MPIRFITVVPTCFPYQQPQGLFQLSSYQCLQGLFKLFSLVEHDSVVLKGKHIIWEDNDFVIPPLMVTDQKLARAELVGVHAIQQLHKIREQNIHQSASQVFTKHKYMTLVTHFIWIFGFLDCSILHVHGHVCVCVHACRRAYAHKCLCKCMYAQVYICMCVCVCTCTCACVCDQLR